MSRFPPGPRGRPLVGSLFELQRDIMGFNERLVREYGDIVGFRIFGRPFCVLGHPDFVEQVLVRDAGRFIKSLDYRKLSWIVGQGLITSEGETWRRQRQLVQPIFHNDRVKAFVPIFVRRAAELADEWRTRAEVDVHADMMRLTLLIVAETLFHTGIESNVGTIGTALGVISRAFEGFPFPYWLPLPRHVRSWRHLQRLNQVMYAMIQARRQRSDPGTGTAQSQAPDLLSLLLAARDDRGRPMSDRQLRDELLTVFLAGHETTAIALSFALWLIAQHPEVESRLREEWNHVIGERQVTAADLSRLDFTRAVLHEAMRLFPPAWFLGRETTSEYAIGGYTLPRGTTIFLCPYLLHRDPRFFPAPERFDPGRWLDTQATKPPRYAYFPFGAGPRSCIGANFAMLEMAAVMPTLLRRVRIAPLGTQPIEVLPAVTLRPKRGIQLALRPDA